MCLPPKPPCLYNDKLASQMWIVSTNVDIIKNLKIEIERLNKIINDLNESIEILKNFNYF
tara:strand:- start:800 stop:979 length:180 start_codon:yes stop_codon:yes gene_type:complete